MALPRSFLIVIPVLALAACGGSAPPPTAPPAPPASAAPLASGAPAPASVPTPPKPWDQLDHKERMEVMKSAVLPNMKTAFQGYDAKDFADFNCATCHGARIKNGNFDMPNPDLPKLDFKHDLKDDIAQHPEMVKFMENTVVAEMTTMLGVPPFDMKTKQGFGCEACHTGK